MSVSMSAIPYFNTYLYTTVSLHPAQMDNNIYKHIKNNLVNKLQNRCYINYGYIVKIYEVKERSGGRILPEDPSASAVYNVKFSCKLCYPIKNSVIVAKIDTISDMLMRVNNGPIDIIINGKGNVNKSIFTFDNKRNHWLIKKDNNNTTATETDTEKNKYIVIKPGMYVKVRIIDRKMVDKSTKMICIGYLEDIANNDEIKENITSQFDDNAEFLEREEVIKQEEGIMENQEEEEIVKG